MSNTAPLASPRTGQGRRLHAYPDLRSPKGILGGGRVIRFERLRSRCAGYDLETELGHEKPLSTIAC